jgi:hypothetical protein
VAVELKLLGWQPFEGILEGAGVGHISITRVTQSAIRTETTAGTIRRHDKHETVTVVPML